MHILDIIIFVVYMAAMLGIGFFFLKDNKNPDDYYVGGRSMGSWHIGLSVVATDVGGGFSIGLGGLGFVMGLSGSWMLFTGLIGAWLSAVVLIPKIKSNKKFSKFYTFPQIFGHFYGKKVALAAGIISAIGYTGFTASQLLAGAKLASGAFHELNIGQALVFMGIIVIIYTVLGGIKAVIYTDTVQWIILMSGLIFIGIPVAWSAVGGWEVISSTLPSYYFSLSNLGWQDLLNWAVTIIPIWFVGMTLYQRIYASRDEKTAKKAWYIAGVFEWPLMAFMGIVLGMLAKVAAEQGMFNDIIVGASAASLDPEIGLPLLLRTILPAGLMGLMMSAYFSAILSTADSCLMAASGNVVTDILSNVITKKRTQNNLLRFSQAVTFIIGTFAIILAGFMTNVLGLMLYSYAFMVSGLLVPLLAGLFFKVNRPVAAFYSMICGGGTTIILILTDIELPWQLDANIFGLTASLAIFLTLNYIPYYAKKYKLG